MNEDSRIAWIPVKYSLDPGFLNEWGEVVHYRRTYYSSDSTYVHHDYNFEKMTLVMSSIWEDLDVKRSKYELQEIEQGLGIFKDNVLDDCDEWQW